MKQHGKVIAFMICLFPTAASAQVGKAPHEIPPHPEVAGAVKKIDSVVAAGPFAPNWKSLESYEIPQWYKDAKLGIFVHWGRVQRSRFWQ